MSAEPGGHISCWFLSHDAMHSADYMLSKHVCSSVCHTQVFCGNGSTYRQTFFTSL